MEEVELIGSVEEIAELSREEHAEVIALVYSATPLRLATLLDCGDLDTVHGFKLWAVQLATQAYSRGLNKAVVVEAQEIARRSERALAMAVFAAQKSGLVMSVRGSAGRSPRDFFASVRENIDAYEMAGVDDELFEEIIKLHRIDGKITRGGVASDCKERSGRKVTSLTPRVEIPTDPDDLIRELAAEGATSAQISDRLNVPTAMVRKRAKAAGIDMPADRLMANTHKINPERIVRETVNMLSGIEYGLNVLTLADYGAMSPELSEEWVHALEGPMRAMRKLVKELKNNV